MSLPLEVRADEYDESTARDIILDTGQVSLHDIYLIHGSEPNRSEVPRRGMTLRYMPTTSVYRRDLADGRRGGPLAMSERTLYLDAWRGPVGRQRLPDPKLRDVPQSTVVS